MGDVIDFRIPKHESADEIKEALRVRLHKVGLTDEFVEYTWPNCEDLIERFATRPNADKEVMMELLHLRINLDLEHFSRGH